MKMRLVRIIGVFEKPLGFGLFKNAQRQGAQETYREAYFIYVERCGLPRNAVYGRFSTATH